MAKKKRTTLPKDFEKALEDGADLAALQAVFESCALDARGGYSKETALSLAVYRNDLVRWLAGQGVDLEAADRYGNTALHSRARTRRSDCGVLIELGSSVHARNGMNETPLHVAADVKNPGAVQVLIAAGADVHARASGNDTPLERALHTCSNIQIVDMVPTARLLLAAGADPSPACRDAVERIGATFEFHRASFNRDSVEATSEALVALCRLFAVEPPTPRRMHDGIAPIEVGDRPWHEQHEELWNLLVPSKGAAATAQGEVIRISGRIAREVDGNGSCNWDNDYRKMARKFLELVGRGIPLSTDLLTEAESIVASLLEHRHGDTRRLGALAVAWVRLNPKPLPFEAPPYAR